MAGTSEIEWLTLRCKGGNVITSCEQGVTKFLGLSQFVQVCKVPQSLDIMLSIYSQHMPIIL